MVARGVWERVPHRLNWFEFWFRNHKTKVATTEKAKAKTQLL
jgi:hypothetical protein